MTSAPTARTRTAALVLALTGLTTGLLSACSDGGAQEAGDVVSEQQAQDYRREVESRERIAKANAALPARSSGVVDVDGATRGTLTAREARRFAADETGTTVRVAQRGEDRAFEALCAGEIDLVDSARTISRSEWEACRDVGLDVVQLQIAADAVVVAVKSETDVGGDCLGVDQVADIYRAGSPIVSWSQVGLDEVPMEVGGPDSDNSAFGFFGRYVLGSPQPALVDLRSDYASFDSDMGARHFVAGQPEDWEEAQWYDDRSRVRAQARERLRDASAEVRGARVEVRAALDERAKGVRDQRPPADRARDQARVDAAYERLIKAKDRYYAVRPRARQAEAPYQLARQAVRRLDALDGRVSYYRFSYYELFEEQLRPFEITPADGERNCIFPSQLTITSGEYPLARQLLITTTTAALERREVHSFLTSYLRRAQRAATDQRLVPLPDEVVATQLRWLSGDEAPVLVSPGLSSRRQAGPSAGAKPAR